MARYIDADKLKGMFNGARPVGCAMHQIIDEVPTADVVPRSTIDEIFALIWDAFQSTYYDSEFEEKFDEIERKYT